jgi:hypothetical protein
MDLKCEFCIKTFSSISNLRYHKKTNKSCQIIQNKDKNEIEKLDKNYISDGQKGVEQFACDNLLKDENGNMNYICSDPSRHIFKFQNSEGNIEKDVKAIKLTNMLIEAGITHKTLSVAPSLWTEEDGNINSNKFQTYSLIHLK